MSAAFFARCQIKRTILRNFATTENAERIARQFGCVKCNFVMSTSNLIMLAELLYVVGLFALSACSRFAAFRNRRLNVAIGLFRSAARALFCSSLFGVSHCNPFPPLSITCTNFCPCRQSLMRLRNYSLCGYGGFIRNG